MSSNNISSSFIHDRLRNLLPRRKTTLEETPDKFEIHYIDGISKQIDLALLRSYIKPRELLVTVSVIFF